MNAILKTYNESFLKGLLGDMLLIRRFEEKAGQMYGLKKIGGFCHLYNGQEAVAVGSIRALDLKRDYVLTGYRDHGHALVCGIDPKAIMAELFGKVTGSSRGKGGSMHLFDLEKHMLGGNGIVGGQIPVATGVAFASAYNYKLGKTKDMGVTLCYFGDGAIHQGSFHESLNLAKIWQIPIVYIVENNQFGMGTAVSRASAVQDFDVKAKGYNIEGRIVEGMDVLSVYKAVKECVDDARKTGNAYLLDVKTYRYRGHSMSDPQKYRTKEEIECYKEQDPIIQLKDELIAAKVLTEADYTALDDQIKARVQAATDFAEDSPEPALSAIYEDIFAE
jgi:pyruvate dehydrogenase E1 component alpha subunit